MKRERERVAIRADLIRVAREIGAPDGVAPSLTAYRERGQYGETKVRVVAGGWMARRGRMTPRIQWTEAMCALGLTPYHETRRVSDIALIRDLRRVALETGCEPNEMPSVEAYKARGRYSYITVLRRFAPMDESWYTAARYLAMQPSSAVKRGSLSVEMMVRDYRRIAKEMGYTPGDVGPTRREFAARVPYSAASPGWHVGSWAEFVRRAGYEAREPFEREAA